MAELTDKLKAFLGMFPDVKAKADTVEAQLEALGVKSKESEGTTIPSDATTMEGTMDATDKELTPEMKKKMEDEKAEKDKGKDNPKEEVVEKKEFDPAVFAQLQSTFEATAKETQELKGLLAASAKEMGELKATVAAGFEAVAKGLEQRDATDKLIDAKVKELAGETPNIARYTPSENMQNVFARIAGGDLQGLQPILKEAAGATQPLAQQPTNPIMDFVNQANQHTGLAPAPNQVLPQ